MPARPSVQPVVEEFERGRFCCSVWQNITFLIWSDRATVDAVQKLRRVTRALQTQFPDGHSNVSFVMDGTPPPAADARAAFADVFDDRVSQLKCMSTIVEGGGFWASGLRAAINGMRIDSSHRMKMKVHTTIDEVVAWLPAIHLEETGIALDPEDLRQALHIFRNGYTP